MTVVMRRRFLRTAACMLAAASVLGTEVDGFATSGPRWATSDVVYYVNPQSIHVSEGAAISAVQRAAAAWSEQSNAGIELIYGGHTSGSSLTLNRRNEVFFRNSSNGGYIAETYWWYDSSGALIDADIVFYEGSYRFFTNSGCLDGIYVEDVAVHEFGHALGLAHSSGVGATMSSAMPGYCDLTQMTLEADDIAAVEALYPLASAAPAPANTAPTVSIANPLNGTSYAAETPISFSGSASDTQDGSLTSQLTWTSSLSGQIGTGGSFSRTLPAGSHVITAKARDTGGLTGSSQRSISVVIGSPGGALLSARGYKVKGLQYADLVWSGLATSSVVVFRDGAQLKTTANDGKETDAIGRKGGGSTTYRVCTVDMSACSNTLTVSF